MQTLDPATNDEDWTLSVEVVSDDDGEAFNLSGSTASFRIIDHLSCECLVADPSEIQTSGSTIIVTLRASRLSDFRAGNYGVALRITNGTETTQLLRACLPITEGGF